MSLATASRSESLRRVLKALAKSSLTRTPSVCIEVAQRRVACTAASAPPGTPTPSWIGASRVDSLATAWAFAHLAARRRSVYPTAIGLMPPSFFFKCHQIGPIYDFVDLYRQGPFQHNINQLTQVVD